MLSRAAAVAVVLFALAGQDTGVLRVRVTLLDAAGVATPIPRVMLLVSDNPASTEPRRARTSADGTIELKLKPGSYTVESDAPIGFSGKGYAWTELVSVTAGRETVLELTAANAEIGDAPIATPRSTTSTDAASAATLFAKWRDAVVEIWTPTGHTTGFIVDGAGLIATSHHALGPTTSVEVEFTSGEQRFKVPGQVVVSERLTGTAIVRVNPSATTVAIDPGCARSEWTPVDYQQTLTAITAPLLSDKDALDGPVSKVTTQAIFADLRLDRDGAGGPVFSEAGELVGISALDEDSDGRRASEPWVVPLDQACQTISAAVKKTAGTAPPPATRLPIDPPVKAATLREDKAAKVQPPSLSSANFDIVLLSATQAREATSQNGPKADFGNWNEYVRRAPPVILIRVSPQFEESFWKMLARGAASTQGMALPPLKSFTSNFLRLQAYCGDKEVVPIHPFVIEHQVPEKSTAIREGLYVFDPAALNAQCGAVRLAMYSEKDPQKADVRTVDAKLFQQVANSLQ